MNTRIHSTTPNTPEAGQVREVAFIAPGLADTDTLLANLRPGVEAVLLEPGRDGLARMAAWAKDHHGYAAIHALSHGAPGEILLGAGVLDAATLASQAETLAAIGKALTPDGDLLLYGCEVAAGGKGQDFIDQLAQLTGADVAASDDLTGLGGDWLLERHSGPVRAEALAVAGYAHALTPGRLVVGDGSGGGGAGYYLPGGNGGGDADVLGQGDATGYNYAGDDVLFGDGSGGGGGPNVERGYAGSGNDTLEGGAGNDILFGDGFDGSPIPQAYGGGHGGLGGGGGGGGDGFTVYPGNQSILGLGAKEGGKGGDGGLGGGGGGGAAAVGGGPGTGGKGGRGGYGGEDGDYGSGLVGGPGGVAYGSDDSYIDDAPYATPAGLGGGGFGSKPGGVQGDNSIHVLPDDAGGTLYSFVLQKLPDVFIDNPNLQLPYGGRTASGYGGGSDVLNGGPGSDQLFGLGGNDVFVFELSGVDDDTDTVWDFDRNGEADRLALTIGGNELDMFAIDIAIDRFLATQSADGADRRLVWRDAAGHGLTVLLKNIGRDVVAADFLTTALPGMVGDGQAPTAVSSTLTTPEDTPRVLSTADLGYSDPDHDPPAALIPLTLPAAGVLQVSQDGVAWTQAGAGQSIAAATLDAGYVRFLPAAAESGPAYARLDFQVSDGQRLSDVQTLTFDVTTLDDPPRPGFSATYTESQGPLHLYGALSLVDPDGGTISAASVAIEGFQQGDRLAVDTAGSPLRAEYDRHTGVLTLTGVAEPADYQQVLRTLGYSSQADIVSPQLRALSLTLTNNSGAYRVDLTPFSLEPSILTGTALGDRLRGSPADDELRGLAGNDRLHSLGGDDLLKGGKGSDTLWGGGGADRYVWTSPLDSPAGADRDSVQDFRPKQGDRLDLSALDADTHRPGNQPFTYIGAGEFSAAGQLRYVYDADSHGGMLAGDTDGDGGADFEIGLVGAPTLPVGALVL